jgi:hypothetical protein
LLDIRSIDAGRIVAFVPESALRTLGGARFSFQIEEGAWRAADLDRLDGMTDFTTRTRTARFAPVGSGAPLEPGAFARVRIEPAAIAPAGAPADTAPESGARAGAAGGAVTVPSAALVRRGGLTGVFVVRDGQARLRWIRIGRTDGAHIEVLAGLAAGEEIVLAPKGLADGRAVRATR